MGLDQALKFFLDIFEAAFKGGLALAEVLGRRDSWLTSCDAILAAGRQGTDEALRRKHHPNG